MLCWLGFGSHWAPPLTNNRVVKLESVAVIHIQVEYVVTGCWNVENTGPFNTEIIFVNLAFIYDRASQPPVKVDAGINSGFNKVAAHAIPVRVRQAGGVFRYRQ